MRGGRRIADAGALTVRERLPVWADAIADTVIDAAAALLARGVLVNPVAFPAVPRNAGGIRITITRAHTSADLATLVDAVVEVIDEVVAPVARLTA